MRAASNGSSSSSKSFFPCFGDGAPLNLETGEFGGFQESTAETIICGGFNGRILPPEKSSSAEEREGSIIVSNCPLISNSKPSLPSEGSGTPGSHSQLKGTTEEDDEWSTSSRPPLMKEEELLRGLVGVYKRRD
uniref:Uncharacterized protein n=1 Tax=Opuntia streptacantha TaxID=393608 RepID=A0A7C9DQH3_OPUST